ncbi:MAG TPA: cytochrome c, partial [Acidimicrobiales bacterium]|nr:cytochrome c [Acidimicrobiales bacterium]
PDRGRPTPPPPYVAAAMSRPKVPVWAMPVLALLPVWAIVYAGVLFVPEEGITDPVLVEGQGIFDQSCASCHGNDGGGGVGRPLSGGEVVLTFPEPEDHLAFVSEGSPAAGTPYGSPDRPGGQHIARETSGGAMPSFSGTLSEEELLAVVRYEREILGGEEESALAEGAPELEAEGSGEGPPGAEAEAEGGDAGSGDAGGASEGGDSEGGGASEGGDTAGGSGG